MQELAAATKIGYYDQLKMLYHILIKFAAAANLFFQYNARGIWFIRIARREHIPIILSRTSLRGYLAGRKV